MILVDSSVWIDFFRGVRSPEADLLDELLGEEPLAIGDLILTEVQQGFDLDRHFAEAQRLLASLTILDLGGREVAIEAAHNFRRLRRLGVTVRKTVDTIIATHCILRGHSLLFSDRDFDPFVLHLGLKSAM